MSRIIAGRARGMKLRTVPGQRTRPTTDRVREALFSSLAGWAGGTDDDPAEQLAGLRMADLYAGSGAVGLEAASRGAAEVVCVEQHPTTAGLIRRNVAAARLGDRVQVRTLGVRAFLAGDPEPFDIVWLDPPYGLPSHELDQILELVAAQWLLPDGLVVVERSKRDPAVGWPPALPERWTRRYGETQLYFGRPAIEPEGDQ